MGGRWRDEGFLNEMMKNLSPGPTQLGVLDWSGYSARPGPKGGYFLDLSVSRDAAYTSVCGQFLDHRAVLLMHIMHQLFLSTFIHLDVAGPV